MTLRNPVLLGDVHSELSCIYHAASKAFEGMEATYPVEWNPYTYLVLVVKVWGVSKKKTAQRVLDILRHGLLHGEYDYRFLGISHDIDFERGLGEPVLIEAHVDTYHWPHRRPRGWDQRRSPVEPSSSASPPAAAPAPPPAAATTL
jgi:hypothetical protein